MGTYRFDHDGPEGEPFTLRAFGPYAPGTGAAPDPAVTVEAALDTPTDAPPLEAEAEAAERVLVLVDDATRHTPNRLLLQAVAARLEMAEVADEDVTLLVAPGTHRPMSAAELDRRLGPFATRWRLRQHDWRDTDQLVDLGTTRDGMPIVVNRLVTEHDFVVGLGSLGVHALMGYSGGAKILMIGAAGAATETWTHWNATQHPTETLMGLWDNPLRRNLEEGATRAGLDAVLNTVLDRDLHLEHAAYGDPVATHRLLAPLARDLSAVHIPQQTEVVVADATPATRDHWQSVKGLFCAALAVQNGGSIVLVSPNPEGVADNHPNLLELASLGFEEIERRVEAGEVDDVIGAAVAALTARVRERARVHLVTSGIADDDVRRLGLSPHRRVQDAVDTALHECGQGAEAMVLDHAGGLLPLVPGRNAHLVSALAA